MSFWSRSKKPKDSTPSTASGTLPTSSASSFEKFPATPPAVAAPATLAASSSSVPPNTRTNGLTSLPSPSSTGGSSQSFASARSATNGVNSPPDSPSTISGISKSAPPNTPPLWSLRKFRNVCPFPRFGHATNATAGKEGEIYVFGGLVKEKRKNDLFVIDSGKWNRQYAEVREYDGVCYQCDG
jgi:Galactose oxidase, central domain